MTSRDFAYWLNGFFEISEQETINEKQSEIISTHLKIVETYEIKPISDGVEPKYKGNDMARSYTCWLLGVFEFNENKGFTKVETTKIKYKLHQLFQKEIDPSYSEDNELQIELNNIHGNIHGNEVMRC